jgi:CDP-glycerol glycerophosphotransferase (TagB/SpsB family)
MRALFMCRISRTKLMVHLAQMLKRQGELDEALAFVAYYDQWRDYLENESPVPFKRIYGTREIFQRMGSEPLDYDELKRIEREYGVYEIWNVVFSERYLTALEHHNVYNHPKYSDEDVLRYVQICFQVAERIFDQDRPDCIIGFATVGIYRGVFNLVAKRRGVPYFYISSALLGNRFFVSMYDTPENISLRKTYHQLLDENAPCEEGRNYLGQFRRSGERSIYRFNIMDEDSNSPNPRTSVRDRLRGQIWFASKPQVWPKSVVREIRLRLLAIRKPVLRYNFQLYKNLPTIKLYRSILYWWRKARLCLGQPFDDGPLPENYVFMTLHFQPEASTSVLAPFFANQRYVVENVARALPLHWKLVVKPHLLNIGRQPVEFYQHVQKIPNVHLVSPTADTRELIMGSKAVVAITGTSGFEALLLGKKVIVFGKSIWSICRSVSKCTDFIQLHRLLREAEYYEPDDDDLAAYLQAVHNHSFPLDTNYVWKGPYDLSDPGYQQAIDEIARQLVKAYQAY